MHRSPRYTATRMRTRQPCQAPAVMGGRPADSTVRMVAGRPCFNEVRALLPGMTNGCPTLITGGCRLQRGPGIAARNDIGTVFLCWLQQHMLQ
jgi:hypothetical protein